MTPPNDQFLQKQLPNSQEGERAILGEILVENRLMADAVDRIGPEDFYSPFHRAIFRAMVDLFGEQKSIDSIAVGEVLRREGQLESMGGVSAITNLTRGVAYCTDLDEYINLIREKTRLRELIHVCGQMQSMALADDVEPGSLFGGAQLAISQICERSTDDTARRIAYTVDEIRAAEVPARLEVVYGTARGECGMISAVANKGKTTLVRNLGASLAVGRSFPPFTASTLPKRVAILDFEDTLAGFRDDIMRMAFNFTDAERKDLDQNMMVVFGNDIGDRDGMLLSNAGDRRQILNALKKFKPDIVFVETLGSAFTIKNENDNAEMRSRVTAPLRNLARTVNAALWVTHHIGKAKSEEGTVREEVHRARGASSLGDMFRTTLNLVRDSDDGAAILTCAKSKGVAFPDQRFELNPETRWFTLTGENRKSTNYDLILEMFNDDRSYSTAEICGEFEGSITDRSVKEILRKAVKNGHLQKIQHGWYKKADKSGK